MIIGGLDKFSLIDYPEHLAAIIFTQGCNFRCHFCYNPMLVVPLSTKENDKLQNNASHELARENGHLRIPEQHLLERDAQVSEDDLFIFLKSRIGKLDAVVISGGEPTLHHDLPEFIEKIRLMNFKIKLDSNGTNPKMLKTLIDKNLLDYIAMDIKGPKKKYDLVVAAQPDLKKIEESIKIIKKSELPYEFRTTIVPGLHVKEDISEMGEMIKGADKWYLQKFEASTDLVNKSFEGQESFDDKEFEEMLEIAKDYVEYCDMR